MYKIILIILLLWTSVYSTSYAIYERKCSSGEVLAFVVPCVVLSLFFTVCAVVV